MTDLVAEAIALCEKYVAGYTKDIAYCRYSEDGFYSNIERLSQIKTLTENLNAWNTHLAELEELKLDLQHHTENSNNWLSAKYKLVTKAKRLLGRE